MSYRFKLNESAAAGAARIGLEQIEIAETRLTSGDDAAAAIHDARRCLKRLRALLRLVRPALSDATYRREAKRMVGIGRLLADARDQHVIRETLAKIESRFDTLPKSVGTKLTKLLGNGAGAGPDSAGTQERHQALQDLEQARRFFAGLGRRQVSFQHLVAGAERSYRRARRMFRDAYENPTDEALHEWRKTVQQHWRHMQLISRAWPEVLGGRAAEAKELSRLLGDDHDIHLLLAFAGGRAKTVLSAAERKALTAVCRSLQREIRETARPRGARLFAEPPGNLSERMQLYWDAARDLTRLSPAREGGAARTTGRKRASRSRRPAAPSAAPAEPASEPGQDGR
jgi:CHAD domain-containing protein